jgi:hypothetical protein
MLSHNGRPSNRITPAEFQHRLRLAWGQSLEDASNARLIHALDRGDCGPEITQLIHDELCHRLTELLAWWQAQQAKGGDVG